MSKPSVINLNDIFGTDEEEISQDNKQTQGTTEVKLSNLIPFNNHPFKLYEGERLNDMIESIKEHGVITPLIVRPSEDNKYEILSGHNRANAGKMVGLEVVPVVIKEGLTDEEAMLIVTETNLIQRSFSELSHSEKARIITERYNVMKKQGRRTDLIREIEMMSNTDGCEENSTNVQTEQRSTSREKVANSYDLSPSSIARLLRIDMLINQLKTRLDNNDEIPFTAGIELSYLSVEEQNNVENLLEEYGYEVDFKKANELKKLSKTRSLTYVKVNEILSGEYFKKAKTKNRPKLSSAFNKKLMQKFKDEEIGVKDIEELILKLVDEYFENETYKEL